MIDQEKLDMEFLIGCGEFRRFLFRAIQNAGILARTTDGSEGRHLAYAEGRRNLGFDILEDAARGQPVDDPEAHLTLLQILREESQKPPTEKPNARRYNRNRELSDGDDDTAE